VKNSLVLKASAGTGKTFRLSIEYIRAILQGENFENILVMTFTRKATAEIRERILEFIKELINESPQGNEISQILKEKYPSIEINRELLKNTYESILKKKEALKIYTIDGFTNLLFKKAIAPHLNIYTYEMVEESKNRIFYEKILDRLLEQDRYFDILKEFFQNNAEKNIDTYIDLIKNILDNRWKFLLIENINEDRKTFSEGNFFNLFQNMIENIREAGKIKSPEKTLELDGLKKDFKTYFQAKNEIEQKTFLLENSKKFIEEENFWMKPFIQPTKKVPETAEICEKIQETNEVFKSDLARYIFNKEVIAYEKHIKDLSRLIFELYDKFKFSEKKFTHTDISTYTYKFINDENLNLIKDDKYTSYFYEILEGNISTIFIDEFQDTSILQWRILKPLINVAHNIICVGDEKQSIYGWRGGEKKLFSNLDKIIDSQVEGMDTSYRSQGEIINFVNKIFGNISTIKEENWEYENVKWLENKNNGFVQTFLINKEDEEDKTSIIVDILKANIKNYSKVGIIARKKAELNEIAFALENAGIPYITNDGLPLVEHRAIKGLYSLIKYFAYKEYIYFLEFIRSDIIDIRGDKFREFLEKQEEVEGYLRGEIESLDISNMPLLKKVLDLKRKKLGTYKIYSKDKSLRLDNLAEDIVREFNITNKFKANSDLKNIYRFYDLFRNFESIVEFIHYVEENIDSEDLRQVAVEELNAVKLMTIHKSKGLEFETEFLYINLKKNNIPNRGLKFYMNLDEKFQVLREYILTHTKYDYVLKALNFSYKDEESLKEEIEELNNLYVAITRPKSNLYLIMDTGKVEDKLEGSDDIVLNAVKYAMNKENFYELNGASLGTFKESEFEILDDLEEKNFEFLEYFENGEIPENKIFENRKRKEKQDYKLSIEKEFKRKMGSAIHFYLENIIHNIESQKEYSRKLSLNRYANMFGEKLMNEIFEKAEAFIEENAWVFDEKWQVKVEYEISEEDGENKKYYRIDRLMIDTSEKLVKIIDYKTGGKDDKQVQKYIDLVKLLVPKDYKVEGEYLFINL